MKLTLKFGIAFLIGFTVVLGGFVWTTLRRETAAFRADTRRDNLLISQVVAASIHQLGAHPRSGAAEAILRRAGEVETPVRIHWVSLDPSAATSSAARLPAEDLEALRAGRAVTAEMADASGALDFVTYVPVGPGGSEGAVEVAEPLAEVQHYTRTTLLRIATTTAAVIASCGALFTVIGMRMVGRPVNELIQGFRYVAGGDLAYRPKVSQRDELGELAAEFGVLCDALAEARRLASESAAKRLEALEQLRHADRLRTVGQLTTGVAHELGTPLNVVWARASMIARGEVLGADAVSCAKIIEDQSQRMTAIIRKLLEFARPRPPEKSPADLRQIARQTVEVLGATARKRGVELVMERSDDPAPAAVDAGQIQQVISNLVLNAIQAMPSGGEVTVGVGLARARPPADVGGGEDEFLCLFVQDQGRGIAEDDLPKIFEPFFTTKDVGEGTGLGLSISRGIIHEHGGWIGVVSRPGEGARFTVYLPRGSAECAAAS